MYSYKNNLKQFIVFLITSIFGFFHNSSYSQITITQNELMNIFTPGNLVYNYDGGDGIINIGKMNGPNLYDFTNINFQDTIIITNYEVSQIPILAERYPFNCTTIGESPQNIVENPIFLQINDSAYFIGEATIADEYKFEYNTPYELFAKFPITFNPPASNFSQWISVVDTTFDLSWQIQSIDNHYNLVDVWIDGYGTLLLPDYSLECLRMKRSDSYWNEKSFLFLTREGLMFIVDNLVNSSPDSGYVNGYYYILKSSTFVSVDNEKTVPLEYSLSQNYPNPFNPSTTINWQSPIGGHQTIKLFNVLGKEIGTIVDGYYEAGIHSTSYIAHSTLPSGVYFYQLKAGDFTQTKKMILIK